MKYVIMRENRGRFAGVVAGMVFFDNSFKPPLPEHHLFDTQEEAQEELARWGEAGGGCWVEQAGPLEA